MKRAIKKGIAVFVAAAMLILMCSFDIYASTTNGEFVLNRVSHSACVNPVTVSKTTDIFLAVPYSYEKSYIDFSNGFDISYNTLNYEWASASFEDTAVVIDAAAASKMTVRYQKKGETTSYETVYKVRVTRLSRTEPSVSGTITKNASKTGKIAFTTSDFNERYKKNDGGGLKYVSIQGVNPSFGRLELSSSAYELGTKISISDTSRLTFNASAFGSITYTVNMYDADTPEKPVGTTVLKINVSSSSSQHDADDIVYMCDSDEAVSFSPSEINNIVKAETGENFSYAKFQTPQASSGALYYEYKSADSYTSKVSSSTKYYRTSAPYVSDITFVPNEYFSGTVKMEYSAYTAGGTEVNGNIIINVTEVDKAEISYKCENTGFVAFSSADFNVACKAHTGKTLSYVKFDLPSSSYGTLYYNYVSPSDSGVKVTNSNKYYRAAEPYIYNITFVPKNTYAGSFDVTYTGYDTDGASFNGKVKIKVTEPDDSEISYTVSSDEYLQFAVSDFNNISKSQTGYNLSYVKFTLPPSTAGTLYHNYNPENASGEKVTSSLKYYRSGEPFISYITFVPKRDYSGTVSIKYTAYNTNNETYTGTVKIRVTEVRVDYSVIEYSVKGDSFVNFAAADFANACKAETGLNLSYVKFSLPSSSYGTLYHKYESPTYYGSKVSATSKYNRTSSPYIYDVAFVPRKDYSGTVPIKYTGYTSTGESFEGTVKIKVTAVDNPKTVDDEIETLTYSVTDGKKTLPASDLKKAFDSVVGSSLSYVKFTLPSSAYGKLYYDYTDDENYDSEVTASKNYYYVSEPYLKKVTFVPADGYSGSVSVKWKGYDSSGKSASGVIKLNVTATEKKKEEKKSASDISYSVNSNSYIVFTSAEFNDACKQVTGDAVSYIKLSLPSEKDGCIYYDYHPESKYSTPVLSSDKIYRVSSEDGAYLIYNTSFVPAKKKGSVSIGYTGVSMNGKEFSGKIKINISKVNMKSIENFENKKTYKKNMFDDVDEDLWYGENGEGAVKKAYELGIMEGVASTAFSPSGSLTVAQAITIAARIRSVYNDDEYVFEEADVWYLPYVAYASQQGIIEGDEFESFENPATRAEVAYIFSRALPKEEFEVINVVTDIKDVDYTNKYRNEIFMLYRAGVLMGYEDESFRPLSSITRAEIAAVVSRITLKDMRKYM